MVKCILYVVAGSVNPCPWLNESMDDDRFPPFLHMIRKMNFLQQTKSQQPLYIFEIQSRGQRDSIDKAKEVVEPFLGASILVDAASLVSTAQSAPILAKLVRTLNTTSSNA